VGQIESLQPKKNFIIVVLCGETNPTFLARLIERYEDANKYRVVIDPYVAIVVKEDAGKA
jgi:hypothetical protein